MLNRRGFLVSLAAALTLDPERLLWVPGKRVISIPRPVLYRVPVEVFAGGCFGVGDFGGWAGFWKTSYELLTERELLSKYGSGKYGSVNDMAFKVCKMEGGQNVWL